MFRVNDKRSQFKKKLQSLARMDFSQSAAVALKESKSASELKGSMMNPHRDNRLYHMNNTLFSPILSRMPAQVTRVTASNAKNVELGKNL